ncbi:MAG: hypothetical protein J6X53_09890 [Abditibacteriota bacterium]|nr:hypothetical protein [Abditibacteriota bacterium]
MTQAEISAQVGVQVATAMTTTLVPIIKGKLNEKQDAEDGKGLSTEDYTTAEKNKLADIASGAEVNIIDSITVNSTAATVSNKTVALTIPTKVSDISNDSGFQTSEQVEASIDAKVSGVYRASESATLATLPALTKANLGRVSNMTESFTTTADFIEGAGITFPLGTNVVIVEALGGGYKYDVLAGFVDLSGKQDKLTVTGAANKGVYVSASGVVSAMTYEVNANVPANFAAASVAPLIDGTAAVGSSMKYAREDHVHPSDINKVDKETGKGLSTNDYTTTEKNKLAGIEAQANKTIIDSTLSNAGQAADAKATGDKIAELQSLLSRMEIYCEASGNPATFSDARAANVKALSVTLTPTQSGSGDPYPPGGGKNLLNYDAWKNAGVTNGSGVFENNGVTMTADTGDAYTYFYSYNFPNDARIYVSEGETYVLSWEYGSNINGNAYIFPNGVVAGNVYASTPGVTSLSYTVPSGVEFITFRVGINNHTGETVSFRNLMIRRASDTDPTFAPYSNVRPISGVSSVTVTRTGENGANSQSVAVPLVDSNSNPLTVYGGTLDVATGALFVTWANIASYNGETLPGRWISDRDVYASGTTPTTGAQVVYELATSAAYQLTPQQLTTLAGYNAVSSDAGNVTVTYKADASLVWGGAA